MLISSARESNKRDEKNHVQITYCFQQPLRYLALPSKTHFSSVQDQKQIYTARIKTMFSFNKGAGVRGQKKKENS